MEPTVQINSTKTLYSTPGAVPVSMANGFWLGNRLPATVASMQVKLNTIFIDRAWDFITDDPVKLTNREYQAHFNEKLDVWVALPEQE